jgi:hypothetical protein
MIITNTRSLKKRISYIIDNEISSMLFCFIVTKVLPRKNSPIGFGIIRFVSGPD